MTEFCCRLPACSPVLRRRWCLGVSLPPLNTVRGGTRDAGCAHCLVCASLCMHVGLCTAQYFEEWMQYVLCFACVRIYRLVAITYLVLRLSGIQLNRCFATKIMTLFSFVLFAHGRILPSTSPRRPPALLLSPISDLYPYEYFSIYTVL